MSEQTAIRLGAHALVIALWGLVPTATRADDSAVASTTNHDAERAYDAVHAAVEAGDDTLTEEKARQFLVRFPHDPLVPRVELELGRIFILRAMPREDATPESVDVAALREAESWLARSGAHADPPTEQRVELYGSIASYLHHDYDAAITALTALRGTLVDPEDRRVQETALHAACDAADRVGCALEALDALRTDCENEDACLRIDEAITALADEAFTDDSARQWVLETTPTRFAWRQLASRVLSHAAQRGDWDLVQAIAGRARAASVALDAEGTEIAQRLDRGLEPNPRVIGVIAGLTGAASSEAMACVLAIGAGAGAPPDDRFNPDAYRIIVRDHHDDPAEAARAVGELFWIHRAIAIIGPSDAAAATTAAARAEVLGVPFVSLAHVEPSRFVTNANLDDAGSWMRREASHRFGANVGFVSPRSTDTRDLSANEFGHTAGRIDANTRTRLGAATLGYLVLQARPSEAARLFASVRASIRRRGRAPILVVDRATFDRLVARDPRHVPDGTLVLERVDAEARAHAATAIEVSARDAFDRIVEVHATSRSALADALARTTFVAPPTVVASRVVGGRLVPILP